MQLTLIASLILFGLLQCLAISLLVLLSKRRHQMSQRLLLFLTLCISISLLPTLLGHLDLPARHNWLLFLPADLSLAVFPLLYIYVSTLCAKPLGTLRSWAEHGVLPALAWLYQVLVWLLMQLSDQDRLELAKSLSFDTVMAWLPYVIAASALYYSYRAYRLVNKGVNMPRGKQFLLNRWLWVLTFLLLLGALLDVSSLLLGQYYGYWRGSPVDDWLGFSFRMGVKAYYALLIYGVSLVGYSLHRQVAALPRPADKHQVALLPRLQQLMEVEQLYLNPDLSLSTLASALQTNGRLLSALINQELQVSYADYVNQYRVAAFKKRLASQDAKRFTLLALARESGFRSKTTFYRAFQKFEGQSPQAYLAQLQA